MVGELGLALLVFLATCHRCAPMLAEPFFVEDDRDDWAAGHALASGHVVHVSIEADGTALDGHTSAMIRIESTGARWLCTTTGCECWNGPYASALIALASFRDHRRAGS